MSRVESKGISIKVPDICETCDIPYEVIEAEQIDEEIFAYMDPASISVTLSKKYGFPMGRVHAWVSLGTSDNPINAGIVHKDSKEGDEVELGGFILCLYANYPVTITVMIPKNGGYAAEVGRISWSGDWKDFK